MQKKLFKQFSFLILLTIVFVSFSGCQKEEIVEEIDDVDIVEKEEYIGDEENEEDENVEECKDDVENIDTEKIKKTIEKKIDTSNWQAYQNDEFGFEIKYPKDWIASDNFDEGNSVFFESSDEKMNRKFDVIWVSYYEDVGEYFYETGFNYNPNSLENSLKNHPLISNVEPINIYKDSNSFVAFENDYSSKLVLFVEKDTHIYIIAFMYINTLEKIDELSDVHVGVLNSFKFTK